MFSEDAILIANVHDFFANCTNLDLAFLKVFFSTISEKNFLYSDRHLISGKFFSNIDDNHFFFGFILKKFN